MKGFYLTELLVALFLMGFVLTMVSSVALESQSSVIQQHYAVLASEISLSVKRARRANIPIDFLRQFAQANLPKGSIEISTHQVLTCWQLHEKQCES